VASATARGTITNDATVTRVHQRRVDSKMIQQRVRSLSVLAATFVATAGLGFVASPAHADCVKYDSSRSYKVSVPTPYGPATVDIPAVTDVNPNDCITLITSPPVGT
jgi:hypothetical protein